VISRTKFEGFDRAWRSSAILPNDTAIETL